eukprot:gb/GFBE01074791.1/.p1 GENE.gb/GFBE01074791.1/~~gb/GFBE01074791.1/.p1  ORF type:complete len:494 (+),score=104.50 gb/GFBE01074791.1/:1-1482(+)
MMTASVLRLCTLFAVLARVLGHASHNNLMRSQGSLAKHSQRSYGAKHTLVKSHAAVQQARTHSGVHFKAKEEKHGVTGHTAMAIHADGVGSFLEIAATGTAKQVSQAAQRASAASKAQQKAKRASEAAEHAQQVAMEAKKVAEEAQEAARKAKQSADEALEDAEDASRSMGTGSQVPDAANDAATRALSRSSRDGMPRIQSTDTAARAHAIPLQLLFTHKVNVLAMSEDDLAEDPKARVLRKNLLHTVASFPDIRSSNIHFWDDSDCQEGIRGLRIHDAFQLTLDFVEESAEEVKSDLCRLAMLYKFGGYYFDTDVLPVVDMLQHVSSDTTFATVLAHDKNDYFQSFIAATHSHPVIGTALKEFKSWYDQLWSTSQSHAAEGRAGALLRKAYATWSRKAAEKHRVVHFGTQHVSQFFEEAPLAALGSQRFSNYGVEFMGTSGGNCDYAVVDNSSSTLIMYSRVFDSENDRPCHEELYILLESRDATSDGLQVV